MKTLNEKAGELLECCDVVVLASIDTEGCPRPIPLSKVKNEGISTLWFATGSDSVKTRNFRSNPNAGVCFYKEGDSVGLTGKVEVVTDAEEKRACWQDWFIAHFPEGPTDPNYVILKFHASAATFWIGGTFIHRALK